MNFNNRTFNNTSTMIQIGGTSNQTIQNQTREVSYGEELFSSLTPTNSTAYMTASMFRNVSVPFICVFGGLGNTMAAITFLCRKLRHTSFNFYLAVRSVCDTLFLLTLLAVWFDSVGVHFFHTPGICQIVVFLSYMTSCLSVWCVTAITFENYIRICQPTKKIVFCTIHRAKRVVFIMCIVSFFTYHTSLWTTVVEPIHGTKMCITDGKFMIIYVVTTYIDTFLTFIIPFFVILGLSGCIIYSVIKSYRRRMRLHMTSSSYVTSKKKFSNTPQAKVTRLLLAVSVVFVILNTPIHFIKLKMLINIYFLNNFNISHVEVALKTVFENMYYVNFSANFLVFFICGESFRRVFWELFCKCCKRKSKVPVVFINAEQQTDMCLLNGINRCGINVSRSRSSQDSSGTHVYDKTVDSTTALINEN